MNDIYSTPSATLTDAASAGDYGSLERGIAGDYQFSVGDTLREAWEKTSGAKGTIWLGALVYGGILIAASVAFALISLFAISPDMGVFAPEVIKQLLIMFISTPMAVGLTMLGVRRAVSAPITPGIVLRYFPQILSLFGLMLLMYLLIFVGFVLLVLPGIYLGTAYYLALPLLVDKQLGVWEALESSRKAITSRWFAVFGLMLVLGLLNLATVVTLFIGLIWTVPMSVIAVGILYRNIFGVEPASLNP